LYSRVFKNNQVTYGRPYPINIPLPIHDPDDMDDDKQADTADENTPSDPEELLEKARQQCDALIKEAGLEADRLLEEARLKAQKEAEAISEEAWQRGYAEGMAAAAEQNRSILEEAKRIRESAAEEYDSILAGMEADIVELVIKAARKAVAGELSSNRDVILQLVASTLSECSNKSGAIIKVSPDDSRYLEENRDRLAEMVEGADGVEIKPDCMLKSGDCIVETPLGSIDGGAGTRLDKIEEAMKEEYEGI
jgi:flagellar assembly protein FliH